MYNNALNGTVSEHLSCSGEVLAIGKGLVIVQEESEGKAEKKWNAAARDAVEQTVEEQSCPHSIHLYWILGEK